MGAFIPVALGVAGALRVKKEFRRGERETKKRRGAEAENVALQERERELRRSGPLSKLRRVGLAPASDQGLPQLGSSGTSLLTGQTIGGLQFNQKRRS